MTISDVTPIAHHECWLTALGDDHQMVVFKSPMLRAESSWLAPVNEHIAKHGLELADQMTVAAAERMMGGKAHLEWYQSRSALRDGLLAYGSDPTGQVSPLRAMWDEA